MFGIDPIPPAKLKVYAPNGDTKELVGYVGLQQVGGQHFGDLVIQPVGGSIEVMNKRVVIQNLETGIICYNPRAMLSAALGTIAILTPSDVAWLRKNPQWPDILELQDNPVHDDEEGAEGLYP